MPVHSLLVKSEVRDQCPHQDPKTFTGLPRLRHCCPSLPCLNETGKRASNLSSFNHSLFRPSSCTLLRFPNTDSSVPLRPLHAIRPLTSAFTFLPPCVRTTPELEKQLTYSSHYPRSDWHIAFTDHIHPRHSGHPSQTFHL